MDKLNNLNQIGKNPNNISEKLQILKDFLVNNNEKEFAQYKKEFNRLSKNFESAFGKNKRYLQNLNSEIDVLFENIQNVVSKKINNALEIKANELLKIIKKSNVENKEYFVEKLNEFISNIRNENDLKKITENSDILETLQNRINFEINNQKSFLRKAFEGFSKSAKAFQDGIFEIPKGLIQMDPKIQAYFTFALSALNIGLVGARAIQNIRNNSKNNLDSLPEIDVFTRYHNIRGFSLTALDNDLLNYEVIQGVTLRAIFASMKKDNAESDYLTNNSGFNGDRHKVRVSHSIHNGFVSIVLIFSKEISLGNNKFTQIFQFIGQVNSSGIYEQIPYTGRNSLICKGNNRDFCIVDKLNGLELSLIDYSHQIVSSKNGTISTIHSYENEKKITYINGYSRPIGKDIHGDIGIGYNENEITNPISYASNSTNTFPTISIDDQNNQVVINDGRERCFDFFLNSTDCLNLSTTSHSTRITSTTLTTSMQTSTPTTTNVLISSSTTTPHSTTTEKLTLPTSTHHAQTSTSTLSTSTKIPTTPTTLVTTQHSTSTSRSSSVISTQVTTHLPTSTYSSSTTTPHSTTKGELTSTAMTSSPAILTISSEQTTSSNNNSTSTDGQSTISNILTTLTNSITPEVSTSSSVNDKKDDSSLNPLYYIVPATVVSLAAIGYFTIKLLRRRNYQAVDDLSNKSADSFSNMSEITVYNVGNIYGTPSTNSTAPIVSSAQKQRRQEEETNNVNKVGFIQNLYEMLFKRNKKNDADLEMNSVGNPTEITTVSGSISSNEDNKKKKEYTNLDSPTILREANQEKRLTEAVEEHKALVKMPQKEQPQVIQVKSAKTNKEEKLKKVRDCQFVFSNLVDALNDRIKLKKGEEVEFPSKYENIKNTPEFSRFFNKEKSVFKHDSFKHLFSDSEDRFCRNNHEIEKLFNEIYTNYDKEKGKDKSCILNDLLMLFDQSSVWYNTEIYQNNQEEKLLEALNKIRERLGKMEDKLTQGASHETSIV